MSDVIIAIVPAPGHEGLTADGPMGERPALLVMHHGAWVPWPAPAVRSHPDPRPRALVLHAPGGPRLGMVRAMDALGPGHLCPTGQGWAWAYRGVEGRWRYEAVVGVAPDTTESLALAHLLLQRGLASEVLVLPVPE